MPSLTFRWGVWVVGVTIFVAAFFLLLLLVTRFEAPQTANRTELLATEPPCPSGEFPYPDLPLDLAAEPTGLVSSVDSPAVEPLRYCQTLRESNNEYYGTMQRAQLVQELNTPSDDSHRWFVALRVMLARDHVRFGETVEAARLLEEALAADETTPSQSYKTDLLEMTAVTYLKMGEIDNALSPSGALGLTLRLDESHVYTNTFGSSSAIRYLLRLLELDPANLTARWLLNIAHTTLGTYPNGVPGEYLIPLDALESGYDVGRFENISASAALFTLDSAGGSVVEDFDNDGLLDIIWSTMDPCESMRYFHNDGNGVFSDHTSQAGLKRQTGGLNIIQTDYNNDGWADVLVMRGGWMLDAGRMRMSLLRNDGGGKFTDVTASAGLATPAYPSQSAAWADYDNDGDLDLFSCNESMVQLPSGRTIPIFEYRSGPGRPIMPSQLFRNNGDGTFTDVASETGVVNFRYCKGAVWGDYDNDGLADLYLSNRGGANRLYRNQGDGRFVDVAIDAGVSEPLFSFPTWFWDYDNDGWLDLYVAGYLAEVWDIAAGYLGLPNQGELPRLYRNDGAGGFIDVTDEVGLNRVLLPMAANIGDLDNDGYLDFYLGTGGLSFGALVPNVMYRNEQGQRFQDVTLSGGFGHLQRGHGIAFGDLDRDGDQDIFAQMGGAYPGQTFSNALYENPGHGNHWITARLVGVRSNRAAIGARVKVEFETIEGARTVYRHVSSGGSFGASPFELEIGLGRAIRIVTLEVEWPASGTLQVFDNVPLDSHLEIREDADGYKLLDIPQFRFRTPER